MIVFNCFFIVGDNGDTYDSYFLTSLAYRVGIKITCVREGLYENTVTSVIVVTFRVVFVLGDFCHGPLTLAFLHLVVTAHHIATLAASTSHARC